MKKNLLIAVLLLSILMACVLTACRPTTCIDGHTWVDGRVVREATCTEDGEMVKICSVCNSNKPVPIPAKGHAFGSWADNEDGLTHSRVCSVDATHIDTAKHIDANADNLCDACSFEMVVVPPVCEHVWVEYNYNGDGTHTKVCEFDETHTEVENCSGGAADCYNGAICDYCYEEYTDALGHDWNEWESNEDGTHGRTCNNSEDCYDEDDCNCVEIGRTPADCESAEVITYGCTECGYTYTEEGEPALNHDWSNWTSNGEHKHSRVCANDPTHVETERCTLDAVDFIDPTCETDGYTLCICDKCGYEHHADIIDAWGHDMLTKYVVENNILYLVEYCGNFCDLAEVKTKVNRIADVSNEADLRTVLENGFNARLTSDITLYGGPIEINSGDITLDLNGKTLESNSLVTSTNALGQTMTVCDVLIVRNKGTKLSIGGNGALVADNDNAESVCVLSVLDGAYVRIDNGTFRSTGCTTIYARTESTVEIWGGTFIAEEEWEGVRYTLDVLETEFASTKNAFIYVYEGKFVGFNPANHTGDGSYTSKVTAASHTHYDEESDTYTVEIHDNNAGSVLEPICSECGLCVNLSNTFKDGDILLLVPDSETISAVLNFVLHAVEGEENTFYLLLEYAGMYYNLSTDELVSNKSDADKYIAYMDLTGKSNQLQTIYLGLVGEEPVAMTDVIAVSYCNNHDVQFTGTDVSCDKDGKVMFSCEGCGLDATHIMQKAYGHTPGEPVTENVDEPTCAEDGSHDVVIYCIDCGEELDRDHYIDLALGHSYPETWTDNGANHIKVCANGCGVDLIEEHSCESTTAPADCENAEVTTYTCTDCGNTYSEETSPALGHKWENYTVNCGGTHTITCSRNDCNASKTENHCLVAHDSIYCVCGVTMVEKAYSVELGDTILIVIEDGDDLLIMDAMGNVGDSQTGAVYFTIGDAGHADTAYILKFADGYLSAKTSGGSDLKYSPGIDESTCLWTISIDENGVATITNIYIGISNDLTIDDGGGSLCFTIGGPECGYTYSIYKLVDHTAEKFAHSYENNQCICDICGEGEHDYDSLVTEPTCMAEGFTTHTCTICGDNYKTDFTDKVMCVEEWYDLGDGTHDVRCIYGCNYPNGAEIHIDDDGNNVCDLCEAEIATKAETYTFDFVSNFKSYASSWGTSYASRTLTATTLGADFTSATFTLSNASKQTGTITDRPTLASKGTVQYVTVEVTGKTIQSITFNLQQWGTKTLNDIHIEYYDGTNWVTCSNKITTPSELTSYELPEGVTQVRLSYYSSGTSSNKQLGITSIDMTLA